MATTVYLYTSQTPSISSAGTSVITVGVRWFADVAGNVLGGRFYKGVTTGGTSHTVALYSDAGALLASKVSSNESDAGWQSVLFDSPVPVLSATAYKIATFWPLGYQPRTDNLFVAQVSNGVLHAYANGGRFNNVGTVLAHPAAANNHGYFADVIFQIPDSGSATDTNSPLRYVNTPDATPSTYRLVKTR